MSKLGNFNPNQPAKIKKFHWATYIPDRYPEFKMHTQANHAKSAFQYRNDAILYKWDETNEVWDEVFKMEGGVMPTCRHGGSNTPNRWNSNPGHSYAKWFGNKRYGICSDCYYGRDDPGI